MPETNAEVFTRKTRAGIAIMVLPRNPNRIVWSAINISDTTIYFGYHPSVSASGAKKGWLIPASNGKVEDIHSTTEVWVICASADKEITIQEVSKVD